MLAQFLNRGGRHWRPAKCPDTPGAEIEPGKIGIKQAQLVHGRNHDGVTHPLTLCDFEEGSGLEPALGNDLARDTDCRQQDEFYPGDVGSGNRQHHGIAIAELKVVLCADRVGNQPEMRQNRALGPTRGARSVKDAERIIFVHIAACSQSSEIGRGVVPCCAFRRIGQPVAHGSGISGPGQVLRQIVFIQDGDRPAVVQDIGGFLRALADIAGNANHPDPRRRDQQHHIVGPVVEQDHQPVAPRQSQRKQASGAACGAVANFVICQAQIAVDHRHFTASARASVIEHLRDMGGAVCMREHHTPVMRFIAQAIGPGLVFHDILFGKTSPSGPALPVCTVGAAMACPVLSCTDPRALADAWQERKVSVFTNLPGLSAVRRRHVDINQIRCLPNWVMLWCKKCNEMPFWRRK